MRFRISSLKRRFRNHGFTRNKPLKFPAQGGGLFVLVEIVMEMQVYIVVNAGGGTIIIKNPSVP